MRRSPTLSVRPELVEGFETSAHTRTEAVPGSSLATPLCPNEDAGPAQPLRATGPLPRLRVLVERDPELLAFERRNQAISDSCAELGRQLTWLEIAVAVLGLALIARAAWPAIVG